jgi:PAS domain S-box-containing protein
VAHVAGAPGAGFGEDSRRIEALYRLTDRLYHAQSRQDTFDAALEAITTGLHCDRASILLLDDSHVMRFVAWRGLSDAYRRAVEGHSPWHPEERDPQPVCVNDVQHAALDPLLKRTVLEEGIQAATFVPLCADGRLIGKFMRYFDAPHVFAEEEIDLSLTIARQLAFAVHRARTEEALRQGERRFREMIDALPVAIYTTDAQGRLVHFNPAAARFSGRMPTLGTDEWCVSWKLYTPDGQPLPHDQCPMAVALKEGRAVRGADVIAERPDGERRWFTPYPTPMLDARGRVTGGINMLLDVTESREADRRKDEFLAVLAHELRNPLAPITNAVHLLRRERDASPMQQEAVSIISRQAAQLTRLVNDLLEVSRITTGRIQLRRDWVLLADVLDSAVQSVRSLVEQHSHQLQVSMPAQPVWVDGDAARLEQVLVNLLNNAAKYTPSGGRIDLSLAVEGDEAVVGVRDTGIGIEPQLLPRVFDLFTQAEKSLHRSNGGLGVGLSLVRNLVQMHGGSVEARSEPGRGSEFIVRLPASHQPGHRTG